MPEPVVAQAAPQAQPPAVVTPQVPAAPVAPTPQAPAPVAASAPTPTLPPDTRERTRDQFEKLLDSNRRLFEEKEAYRRELEQRRIANQTFAPVQQVQPPPQQVNPADFVETDPVTGESFINTQKMSAHMSEIQQRATRAEQAIQSYIKTAEEREIERQSKEAFTAYPDLNPGTREKPNPQFNENFNKQVRGVLLDSMYNADDYGGRPLSFKEAADLIRSFSPQAQQPAPVAADDKEAAKKKAADAAAAQQLKEQSSAQVPSTPQNIPQPTGDEELQKLRVQTRYGSDEALAKRLMHTEHIVPKGST